MRWYVLVFLLSGLTLNFFDILFRSGGFFGLHSPSLQLYCRHHPNYNGTQVIYPNSYQFDIRMPKRYGNNLWQVEAIVGMKYHKQHQQILYQVKWKGFDKSQNTWEPSQNLRYVKSMIQQFHRKQRSLAMSVKKEPTSYKKIKRVFKANKKNSEASNDNSRKLAKQERTNNEEMLILDQYSDRVEEDDLTLISKTNSKATKFTTLPPNEKNRKNKYQRPNEKAQPKSMQTKIQPKQSMQAQEDSQMNEDRSIEDILINCQKLEETTILLKRNKLYFQIPFIKEGIEQKLEMSSQQILKINPSWLNAYYMSFLI